MSNTNTRLNSLDFLRAIGAIFIVVSHSHGLIRKRFETLGYTDFFWQVEQGYTKVFGAIGVDLFLVLSGFFAFYTTWNKKNDAFDFLKKRLIRIYPIWWVALLLLIVMSLIPGSSADYSFYQIFNSIILNPIYIDGDIKPILEIGWTLHYIVFYYFLISFLLLIKFNSLKILKSLTAVFVVLSTLGLFVDFKIPTLEVITNPRTLSFALGGWLAYFVINKSNFLEWKPFHTVVTLCFLGMFIGLFVFIDEWRLNAPTLLSRSTIATFIIVLLIFNPRLKKLDYGKVFKVCGDASYSIYLFHMFPLMIVSGLWKRGILMPPDFFPPVLTWLILIMTGVVAGVIAYQLFEKPVFMHLKKKLIIKNVNLRNVKEVI